MKNIIFKILNKLPFFGKLYKLYKKGKLNPYKNYGFLSKYLSFKDSINIIFNPRLKKLHQQLDIARKEQISNWNSFVYCKGYYYQGYSRIGINGIKPTEKRMKNYNVFSYFNKNSNVLDIGSNSGFMSCYLGDYFKRVVGIELNPYLIQMSNYTKEYLNFKNVEFIEGSFIDFSFNEKFDAVFSLSNHFTIDGNLNIGFDSYISKIYQIMNNQGIMFFESHDINGDDSDLDLKFKIASKYFELIEYKMVKSFYPADIDKLFAVFRKREIILENQPNIDFKLKEAKHIYSFRKNKFIQQA